MTETTSGLDPDPSELLERKLGTALERLERTSPAAKVSYRAPVLDLARRLLAVPGGAPRVYALGPRLEAAGLFAGTDWEDPSILLPGLVAGTLDRGDAGLVTLEALSELRLLAVARGDATHPGVPPEQARHFLTQVLALNLRRVLGADGEADRARDPRVAAVVRNLHAFLLDHIGFEHILDRLLDEIWRILAQRPIQVEPVKGMITQISLTLAEGTSEVGGDARLGADRLISALFGPTRACRDDPGIPAFLERVEAMDPAALRTEAHGFSRAMHDTGLVSDYHAAFVRWLVESDHAALLPEALGLSSTGLDALRCYEQVVHRLVLEAIHPATSQAVFGLAMLLERGVLYAPGIAPALWRQIALPLSAETDRVLAATFGDALPPRIFLLAGVLEVLGRPLGVGQGNNPTCQSARAISMWAYADPEYLLHLVAEAARDDAIVMRFEGLPISSAAVEGGPIRRPLDTDPVSVVLVPHLDRIYLEMGRRCADRGEDPHRWVNPEFHGWWVGREFHIAVDVATGMLRDHGAFVRRFHAGYHPLHNGNRPVIQPQPAGIAVTDSGGRFVGWHAITIQRVALDGDGTMRVYFYNPNNDSGQDWGRGVVVSTEGHGEWSGESSLPFDEFASRLYVFHDEPVDANAGPEVATDRVERITRLAVESWAADRVS